MRNLIQILVLCLISSLSFGQINFYKQYSSAGYDYGEGLVQLEDSSYVICGSSSSFGFGPSQAFIMKVDSIGNFLWSKDYGGSEAESAKRVLYKKNFGFFIAGYTNSYGNGAYDCYLAKTSTTGALEWEKTFGGTGWDRVNDAALTRDTGTMLIGQTSSTQNGDRDAYFIRTNSDGDTLWTKKLGGSGDDEATTIRTYQDSMFLVGGNLFHEDSLKSKVFIMLLHEDGTIYDVDTLGNNGIYRMNDLCEVNDTVQAVGDQRYTLDGEINQAYFQLTINGTNFVPYGNFFYTSVPGDFSGQRITPYGDSSKRYVAMMVEGTQWSFQYGPDLVVDRFNNSFGAEGQVSSIREDYPDLAGQLIPTSDGGAAMSGSRSFPNLGEGGGTVFLIKFGPGEVFPAVLGVTFYDQIVSVTEIENSEHEFNVYPNPTTTAFNVELPTNESFEIHLYNALGQELLVKEGSGKQTFDVAQFNSGIYTVSVRSQGRILSSHRVVIQ